MAELGHCRDCRWWAPSSDYLDAEALDVGYFGECLPARYSIVVDAPSFTQLPPQWPDLAYAAPDPCGQGEDAVLRTAPTFGCVQFTPKEPVDA